MVLAPWIKALSALRTFTSAGQVFLNAQDMLTGSTKHRFLGSLASWPHSRLVIFTRIMAADAGVKLLAAKVLDGDDV